MNSSGIRTRPFSETSDLFLLNVARFSGSDWFDPKPVGSIRIRPEKMDFDFSVTLDPPPLMLLAPLHKNSFSDFQKNFFLSLLSFWLQSSKEWTRDKSLMAPNFSVRLFNALSLKLLSLSFVSLLFSHIHIHTHSYSFTHSYTYSCTRSPMHVHAPRQSSIL